MNRQHESIEDEELLAPLLREHYARELGDVPTGMQLWPGIAERIGAEPRATRAMSDTAAPDKWPTEHLEVHLPMTTLRTPTTPRPTSRWRAVAAVLAASLVVAMSVAIFAFAAPNRAAHGPTARATATTPAQPLNPAALIPSGTLISQIQMLSPADGWAVGSKDYQNTALVLHYTAGQWHVAATIPGGRLEHLTMLSPTDGWAAGIMERTVDGHSHPSLLVHFTGGQWVQVPPPLPDTADFHMLTPNTGYLVGLGLNAAGDGPQDHLALYDRGAWHEVPLPADLFPITLTSLADGWALGDKGQLWRFHNGTWSASGQSLPAATLWGGVQMLSPTDGWAAGYNQTGQVTTKGVTIPGWPFLEHYNGTTWQRAAVPAGLPANSALNAISMESPDSGWAWGTQNNTVPAVLLHYTLGTWSRVPLPKQVFGVDTISSASPTEAWAAGEDFGAPGIASMLLHEKDGVWTVYSL